MIYTLAAICDLEFFFLEKSFIKHIKHICQILACLKDLKIHSKLSDKKNNTETRHILSLTSKINQNLSAGPDFVIGVKCTICFGSQRVLGYTLICMQQTFQKEPFNTFIHLPTF